MIFRYSAFILISLCQTGFSQSIEIHGEIESDLDVENIHIINKTQQVFTVSNKVGQFVLKVALNDTIAFTSIQHQLKKVVISRDMLLAKQLNVKLKEQINNLDEVKIGKVLTGDLWSDISNTEGDAPINFYDVGIPGYTGKMATQSERRLKQANGDGLSARVLIPQILTGKIALDPIINGISGRTKMLKRHVKLEETEALMSQIKTKYFNDFFKFHDLNQTLRMDFYYFCQEDIHFIKRCKDKSNIEILGFLNEKLKAYKLNVHGIIDD